MFNAAVLEDVPIADLPEHKKVRLNLCAFEPVQNAQNTTANPLL
jgi:hypothetical protein